MGLFGTKTSISAPQAPQYNESMRSILQSQIDLAPQVYAQEAIYQPQYQKLQGQIQAQSAVDQLALYKQLQPSYSELESAYNKATQMSQLQGLQERAPEYVQAFQQAQGIAGINNAIKAYAEGPLAKQLQNGFQLTPEEQRTLNQQTMAPYAMRGTAGGTQSNMAGVLNRYNYTQQRQDRALQMATGIGGYLSQQSQPALASFYQQPMYAGTAGGQSIQNALMSQQQAGPALFNPESQTGMGSIYGAYNAQVGFAGAQAQAEAAMKAGRMAMIGSIVGGGMSGAGAAIGCWVAREVYGNDNPAWEMFREWLMLDAPAWFRELYIQFGERFAEFIRNKPILKAIIRKWMDSKIGA